MSVQDDDGTYDEEAARRSRRRKQAVVGAAGVAAVVAGGAFFVAEARTAKEVIAPDAAAAPYSLPVSPSAAPSATAPAAKRSTEPASRAPAAKVTRLPSPTPSAAADTARAEVEKARKEAAKEGVPVQRPVPPVTALTAPVDLRITETGNLKKDRGTMRVVSARSDLTGYRELAWPAGGTETVGDASCTQTFKFANNVTAERKANLLVCWRTSAKRSVYTVTVDLDGKPSRQDSVAALAKQWDRLG